MRCQKVVSFLDENINSWISEVKQYEETIANEQSQKRRGECQINEIMYGKGWGGAGEGGGGGKNHSKDTYILNG